MGIRRSTVNTRKSLAAVAIMLAAAITPACGNSDNPSSTPGKAAGTEGGPCYGNGTCNADLVCLSNLCVNAGTGGSGGSGDAGLGGTGGASGTGGTAGDGGPAGAGGTAGGAGTSGAAGSGGEAGSAGSGAAGGEDGGVDAAAGAAGTSNNCASVPNDSYEDNETCDTASALAVASEGAGVLVVGDATLHHQDGTSDTDWYQIHAEEASHVCFPGASECYLLFEIAFTPPAGVDHTLYQMCLSKDCANPTETCTTSTDWNGTRYELALQWQGTCQVNDDQDLHVRIARSGGTASCTEYELQYEFSYTDEACP